MAINRNFYTPHTGIQWNGEFVCDVRGLSPNDITRILAEDGEMVAKLVEMFENDAKASGVGPDGAAQYVEQNAQRLFGYVIAQVPRLVAKLIAIAADDPEAAEAVETWPLPLQFDIAREIAILTFVDADGFRKFLGNVTALAGSLGGQRTAIDHQAPSIPETADTAG